MCRIPIAGLLVLLALPARAQQFVRNTADVPASTAETEQVDFADVDSDGDWDAAFANGGDLGNQQNRIWINQGYAQAGILGRFLDATATRFPALSDASRDIEFADYDGDGDPDIYVANDSDIVSQTSRLWTNQGGTQGGTIGAYVDETATRWIGLGGAGSSIFPPLVLVTGGYVDWANDGDFGDIDSDGDLDLIQATWGNAASGNVPSRIFLNDGLGHFEEFNPSGFQLSSATIANGSPGLWCQGTHQSNTVDSSGLTCDVATSALNADWGDIDGDLDLDLILGSRQEKPRMYRNLLTDTGALAFRDVTGAAFAVGYAPGFGHYEECFGDLDDDEDLDLYGVNWNSVQSSFSDQLLRNDGSGYFAEFLVAPGSQADDTTAEPIDYDNDGDLDIFVANFSGQERVLRNDGGWAFSVPTGVLPADSTHTLDSDPADVDGDGDTDVFCANGSSQPEWYLQNTTGIDDTTPPRTARLESAPDRDPGPSATVVRADIYGNASLQTSQYHSGELHVIVDAGALQHLPLGSSFGQIFRGAIDGLLVGLVAYRVRIADEHGNVGVSPWKHYAAGLAGTPFCSGAGSGTACPCGNSSSPGRGCGNSLGTGARLVATGQASLAADTLVLAAEGLTNSSCLFFQGDAPVAGGAGAAFGDGLRCAGGAVIRLGTKTALENLASYPQGGDAPISVRGQIPPAGGTRHYQVWYRNAAGFCTASTFNLTNGWTVTWGG